MINGDYILIPRSLFEKILNEADLPEGVLSECQSVIISNLLLPTTSDTPSPSQECRPEVVPEKLRSILSKAETQYYTPYQQKVHRFFSTLDQTDLDAWKAICHNADFELCKMYVWLMGNRNAPKKNLRRFCANWINRAGQETKQTMKPQTQGGTSGREL